MKRFQIEQEEYEAIKATERATKDKNVSRRLRILMLRYEGYSAEEAAKSTGLNRSSVYLICQRYKQQGLKEFIRNKHTSHRRVMSEASEKEILERYEKEAENGHIITVQEIKRAFDEAQGRDTGNAYIYRVLKRHGWRKVMPRSRHPKAANEEACEASKKLKPAYWKPEKTCSRNQTVRCD